MTTTTLFAVENIAVFDNNNRTYIPLEPQFIAVTYDTNADASYADAKKAATTEGKRKAWEQVRAKRNKRIYSQGVTTYPLAHFNGSQRITRSMAQHLQKHNLNTHAVLRNAEILQNTQYHYDLAVETTTSITPRNNEADAEITSTTTIIPINATVTDTSTLPAKDALMTAITL